MSIIRSLFKPKHCIAERRRCPLMDRYTKYALYVAIFCSLWLSFKYVEPTVFPVVKDFTITKFELFDDNSLLIKGKFNKVRRCDLKELLAYSGDRFINVTDTSFNKYIGTTRLTRVQNFGPWVLTPKTNKIELYVRSSCFTGTVITPLFNGAIVL